MERRSCLVWEGAFAAHPVPWYLLAGCHCWGHTALPTCPQPRGQDRPQTGRWGHPATLGQRAMGHFHGQEGPPSCPLPPAYLQEGGVGGIQLGVTLHLQVRGMILAPWGALSLAEVAHGYCHWPMAPQLAHPTPARRR